MLPKEKDLCQVFMDIQNLTQAFPGTLHIFGLPVERPCSAAANDTEASSDESDSSKWVHVKYDDGKATVLGPNLNAQKNIAALVWTKDLDAQGHKVWLLKTEAEKTRKRNGLVLAKIHSATSWVRLSLPLFLIPHTHIYSCTPR
jgi:hypothetical protein